MSCIVLLMTNTDAATPTATEQLTRTTGRIPGGYYYTVTGQRGAVSLRLRPELAQVEVVLPDGGVETGGAEDLVHAWAYQDIEAIWAGLTRTYIEAAASDDQAAARTADMLDFFGENVIHTYTRAQAIADGTLVEVDQDAAREAGFRCHVAMTRAAFENCVAWPEEEAEKSPHLQDEPGRLWDVLMMARRNIGLQAPEGQRNHFPLCRIPRRGYGRRRYVSLVLVLGGGDNGEPVVTIMQPDED